MKLQNTVPKYWTHDSMKQVIDDDTGLVICDIRMDGHDHESRQLVGALIAAAPGLLAACRLALVRLEGGTADEIAFNAHLAQTLRARIAEATQLSDEGQWRKGGA